ncbi:hypothetical protein B566_EDAN010427 [Ephemera danica]|nr:hypothetical protein B566_EDAN010427 [Ephemera danica]
MEYVDEVAAMYPQLATLEIIGQSYEGRPLKVLKISNNSGPKPIVFVNAGIHGSEWPGEAMAMYCINQLTEFAALNQEMLDLADWYILTVSNPDGYEFSWTDDRAWRKTRRPNNGTSCIGTDPNRNFDIHWGEGGEADPCLWNYPGPYPYSESEIRALADYVTALGATGRLELYMDVHTPGAFHGSMRREAHSLKIHIFRQYSFKYTVWRTKPLTNETIQPVLTLLENFTKFSSSLPRFVGHEAFIMSTPEHVSELLDELNLRDLTPELYVENVQTLIDAERSDIADTKTDLAGNVTFDSLMQLHEIDAYLDTVVQTYPELASLEVIGHSFEGRALRVLKISKNDDNTRPAVFVDAGIHAREWVAPPVALYVVQQLTTAETSMLDLADWYILPVANPDGYVYSWNEDRFWRKNRRKVDNSDCVGIDLNRNFDIHFGKGKYARSACWSSYPGTHAFSEPEAEAIGNLLTNLTGRLSLYMSIHCPGPFRIII